MEEFVVKKLILFIIIIALLLITACSNSSNKAVGTNKESLPAASETKNSNTSAEVNKTDLVGTWERTGDLYEGLQVKVEKQGDKYKSSVLKLDKNNKLTYLTTGAEKWREITKKQDNLWTIKDYGVDQNKKEELFDMDLKLSDGGDKLELSDIDANGKEAGSKQVWNRIN
jgi:hypothetical protein